VRFADITTVSSSVADLAADPGLRARVRGVTHTEHAMSRKLLKAPIVPALGLALIAGLGPAQTLAAPPQGGHASASGDCSSSNWGSGEIQQQIGSKNKDKKKLVFQVWFECFRIGPNEYRWQARYVLKSEDKDLVGSGWHTGSAPSGSYSLAYKTGQTPHTASGALSAHAGNGYDILTGVSYSLADVPVFTARSFHAVRSGGSNGITINWP